MTLGKAERQFDILDEDSRFCGEISGEVFGCPVTHSESMTPIPSIGAPWGR